RKVKRAGNAVADRVDATISGLELSVHDDARPFVTNSRGFEIEVRDRWAAPGGNEEMATGDRLLGPAAFDCRGHCPSGMCNADNVHTTPDNDAFVLELGEHNSGAFGIVFAERLRRFEDRHGASEAAEALRQFKTRLPGADDDEMLRSLCKIEDAF